ncbi:PREDICTED: flowering time control protein FCA isoform X2 [Tarenaya hassleriana]|uniref:flowering time control protein FCA isoform X2 n=1 Tax=Tarenaya hassleriana TaxID=28532 RepID=UPI00053C4981|nr:PREDICTED: flowering time control protein FCA isoform X2 [Tarenaya hassleriana]
MDRGAANTFNGPQDPYYHNNYNHHQFHHHHHHVAAVGYQPYGQNDSRDQRFNQPHYDHYSGHQNMVVDHNGPFYGGGYGPHGGVRKRRSESITGASPDPTDGGNAKLYVAPVPRTATEDEVRNVFREHGNVTEIILPRDKRTGERAGYCFVKYKTIVEGDRAIAALQDQYTFPGEVAPVKVRYADGERERIVQIPDKLYVGCLSKQTTKPELHEVFSSYGVIEDIYMALDGQKQSRGYAFVQFSRREMALAAIQGLNGVFTMRGSDQPLTVKFADPKKPRLGEPRSTPNAAPTMQQCDPHWYPQGFPQWGNHREVGGPRHDFSLQPTQFQQQTVQAASDSEVHKQIHQDIPSQNSEQHQQQKPEVPCLETRSDAQIIASNSSEDPKTSTPECDWSEHTCPDGYRYYYNCVSCQSTWEMPKEYTLFEKWLDEHTDLQDPKHQSPSSNCQSQEAVANREEQTNAHLSQHNSTGLEQVDVHLSQQSVGPEQTDDHLSQQSIGPEQTDSLSSQQRAGPEQTDGQLSQPSFRPEQTDAHLAQESTGPEQTEAFLSQERVGPKQMDALFSQPSVGPEKTDVSPLHPSTGREPADSHLSQESVELEKTFSAHNSQESGGLEQNDESTGPEQTNDQKQSVGLLQTDVDLSLQSGELQQPSLPTTESNLEQPVTSVAVGASCS